MDHTATLTLGHVLLGYCLPCFIAGFSACAILVMLSIKKEDHGR